MQNETEEATNGNYASDPSVNAEIKGTVEMAENKIEGDDDKKAEKDLAETGTSVKDVCPAGMPTGTPAQVAKSAALKQKLTACINAQIEKEAALKKASEEAELAKQAAAKQAEINEVVTATEVLNKVASFTEDKTAEELAALTDDIEVSFKKLAATNPLFNVACEQALIRKMAAEVEALAASEGIPPEEAAAALDAAVAEDPEAMSELTNEAEGEALSDLAAAEQDSAALMDGLDQTAAQLSEALGEPVTSDDILAAVDEVTAQAEQLGVPPEALVQAAAAEMAQGA